MFRLSTSDLEALNVDLTEVPYWVKMMFAFRQAATAQSGLCEFIAAEHLLMLIQCTEYWCVTLYMRH